LPAQIIRCSPQPGRIIFHISQCEIAAQAQQTANPASGVTVVHVEASPTRDLKADGTPPILGDDHGLELLGTQAVRVPAISACALTPQAPGCNNLVTLLGVPSFGLLTTALLAHWVSALRTFSVKAESLKRLTFAANITDFHGRSANPPLGTLNITQRRKRRQKPSRRRGRGRKGRGPRGRGRDSRPRGPRPPCRSGATPRPRTGATRGAT